MVKEYAERTKGVTNVNEKKSHEPTLAPGMNTSDPLEEKATKKEQKNDEYTEVTKLYLDRTPDE